MAGIQLGSGFDLNSPIPLDSRTQVENVAARDAIPTGNRYEGLLVYVKADKKYYSLAGGVANTNWSEMPTAQALAQINTALTSTVKKVNGVAPSADGNVTIQVSGDIDTTNLATKDELQTKADATDVQAISTQLADKASVQQVQTLNTQLAERVKKVNGVVPDVNGNVEIEVPDVDTTNLATKTELQVEQARISNLVANAGDTDGNAELLDLRVGADGSTNATAGETVRKVDKRTQDIIDDGSDAFCVTDGNGNVIFRADENGVSGVGLSGGGTSSGALPYAGKKMITIGDSLCSHDRWQKWLVEWLGVTFDKDENINGKNGYAAMAVGGTSVSPMVSSSIYMRSLDAKHYNPDVIIVYAGQNDAYVGDTETGEVYADQLGTIDDAPYTAKAVTTTRPTFYAAYTGMVENLIKDNPNARIFLMTHMPVRLEVGMVGTVAPWTGIVRFETEADAQLYEKVRYAKVVAIRNIAEKYNLPVIDLWKDAGVNHYNASTLYSAVEGGAGQVHPNDTGYKRMAECAYAKL